MMEQTELAAMASTARRFAREVVGPMVGTEGRDGAIDRLDAVLDQAAEVGLLASAAPDAPGYDYGVWGEASGNGGIGSASSLMMLEQLATACAGVASCVHFAGLGAAALRGTSRAVGRAAVAFSELAWARQGDGFIGRPGPSPVALSLEGELSGACQLVHAAPRTEMIVLCCATPRPLKIYLPAADADIERLAAVERMGLAACDVFHLKLDSYRVAPDQAVDDPDQNLLVAALWQGLSAIAIGNAQGALQAAREYASERRQGGRLIAGHPAVQLLLGAAESRVVTSRAALLQLATTDPLSLRHAAMLKVRVAAECADAVSDCLQVLGGYGYMEDYRLEKRLRDALTLKSLAGRPDDLLQRIAISAQQEAS